MKTRSLIAIYMSLFLAAVSVAFAFTAALIQSSWPLWVTAASSALLFPFIFFFLRIYSMFRKSTVRYESLQKDIETLESYIGEQQNKIENLNKHEEVEHRQKLEFEHFLEGAVYAYNLFEKSLKVIDRIFAKIEEKTQHIMFTVSDQITELSEQGQDLEQNIETFLVKVFKGEDSLDELISSLHYEVNEVMGIDKILKSISSKYNSDMGRISGSIHEIKDYTENISDIAEKTSLLAINASIEATRAGNAGKGFFVIANEMQDLAKSSKSTSEMIYEMMDEIAKLIDKSYEKQKQGISDVITHLDSSKEILEKVSSSLSGKLKGIDSEISEVRNISSSLNNVLDKAIVEMQMQDPITQMMSHSQALMEAVNRRVTEKIANIDEFSMPNDAVYQDIRGMMKDIFSIQEEWDTVVMINDQYRDDSDENITGMQIF